MDYQPERLTISNLAPRTIVDEITIVIPTLGRPILEESLYWIVAGTAWPRSLIVVDQGGNPQIAGWMEALRSLGIAAQYIPSSQRGRAAGVNRGLEAVRTRFVAVTDDDCFVEEDWLENMVAHLQEHPGAIVTGRVEPGNADVSVVVTSRTPSVQRRPSLIFDHMSGGNMGTSVAVLERVGLFDEDSRLRTAEDGEWAYRALRSGIPIYYLPDICVRHFGWRTEGERATQYRDYARSHGGFYGKYLRRGDWFIAIRAGLHYLRAARRWLRGIISRDDEMASMGRAYVTGLLPGIVSGMRRGAQP